MQVMYCMLCVFAQLLGVTVSFLVLQAIFLARGPYFKKNYVSEGFENVQVYSLLCGESEYAT